MSFREFAVAVLSHAGEPLTYQEIYRQGCVAGLDRGAAFAAMKAPEAALGRYLLMDTRDNTASPFAKVDGWPVRFALAGAGDDLTLSAGTPEEEVTYRSLNEALFDDQPRAKGSRIFVDESTPRRRSLGSFASASLSDSPFRERDLHPYLADFVANHPLFHGAKTIYSKTVYHERSTHKKGYSEWSHPDMVGIYLPAGTWHEKLWDFSRVTNVNAMQLFSFELKLKVDRSNYREYFFQAVSNSSWANEGYLVAGEVADDSDLLQELERLVSAFGIGLIELDRHEVANARIRFAAKPKAELDWTTMDKLCSMNPDFRDFIDRITRDVKAGEINPSGYDPIT